VQRGKAAVSHARVHLFTVRVCLVAEQEMDALQVPIFTRLVQRAHLPPIARVCFGLPLQQDLRVCVRDPPASRLCCAAHNSPTLIADQSRTQMGIIVRAGRCTRRLARHSEQPAAPAHGPPAPHGARRPSRRCRSLPRSLPPGATVVQRQAAREQAGARQPDAPQTSQYGQRNTCVKSPTSPPCAAFNTVGPFPIVAVAKCTRT